MAHKVVVGGFGSTEKQMSRIAESLSGRDEEFFGFSFRQANDDPNELFRMLKGAEVYTHSAGLMAIRHTQPEIINGIAPPLHATPLALVGRAALCGYDATRNSLGSLDKMGRMLKCGRELAAEVTLHAAANLGRLARIAAFDAIEYGIAAQDAGARVGLGFMEDDRLFIPSAEDIQKADEAKLPLITLGGGHVDFSLRPVEILAEYRSKYEKELEKYGLVA